MKNVIRSNQSGFTLIELLISMLIIILIGGLMVTIFVSTLKGTEKSQKLVALRQKGTFALSQMVKTVRTAEFASCSSDNQSVQLTMISGEETTYACNSDGIASQSASSLSYLVSTSEGVSLPACSFRCKESEEEGLPYVTLSFSLAPQTSKASQASDSAQLFTTTVLLRNSSQ